MPPASQAPRHAASIIAARLTWSVVIASGCLLSACSMSSKGADHSITNSISPQTAATGDTEQISDETTVRNAVSSADPSGISAGSIGWANAATGSRGAISSLVEAQEGDVLCRRFTTTRESFEGIALYTGKACMTEPGSWKMMAFSSQ